MGFPKTSGSRGMHVNVPIEPRWTFTEVRRAALALARELERRLPDIATSAWWKEQRGERVFVDYNQNARDRTVASAYSVRANPEARVSCPLEWDEVPDVDPGDLTIATVPGRFATRGDPAAGIDERALRPRVRCSSSPTATRPKASAMRRGHRTSPNRRESRTAPRRAGHAAPEPEEPPSGAGRLTRARRARPRPTGRRCTTRDGGPGASAGTWWHGGSGHLGGGRRPPRTRAPSSTRLPAEVLARVPPRRRPRLASRVDGLVSFVLGPRRPGMALEASTAVRGELVDQLPAPSRGERGRHPDVMEDAVVVEEAEEQRPHHARRTCATGSPPPRSRRCARA